MNYLMSFTVKLQYLYNRFDYIYYLISFIVKFINNQIILKLNNLLIGYFLLF